MTTDRIDRQPIADVANINIDNANRVLGRDTQMLTACASFAVGKAPTRRCRDDPALMQFLRSL
jgi:hypothetical protein